MIDAIDNESVTTEAVPAYLRIKRHLKEGLASGQWRPGDRMPSEGELVVHFNVSRMTVNRALRELQAEGLVDRNQGAGTFAACLHRLSSTLTIRDMREEVKSRGHQYRAQVIFVLEEMALAHVASRLRLDEGDPVFHSLVVHYDNDVPIQYEDRYVNPAAAPKYLKVNFSKKTPTEYLLKVAPTWEAAYTIEAGMPTQQEATLLKMEPCDACLIVTRWTISRGLPVTWARLVHPGAHFQLAGQFRP